MRRLLIVCLVLFSSAAAAQPRGAAACSGVGSPDRIESLNAHGDLLLSSGRVAKLAEVRLPESSPFREAALSWLRERVGAQVLVHGGGSRDRWDRVSVRIRQAGASPHPDLGHGLVAEGLAVVDPGSGPFCQPELLAAEEEARVRRLGVWADASYNPIDAGDADRLRDRVGSFTMVEGRVLSVGERRQRTYLNFGGHWAEDFTIIIPQRTWKLMTARGVSAATLQGKRIRSRGILQSWQGTVITIVIPEMIEHLEGRHRPR